MNYKAILIGVIAVTAVLLVWGLIGASQADDVGISCNTGLGNSLCWTWEQNTVGDIQEFFEDVQESQEES